MAGLSYFDFGALELCYVSDNVKYCRFVINNIKDVSFLIDTLLGNSESMCPISAILQGLFMKRAYPTEAMSKVSWEKWVNHMD